MSAPARRSPPISSGVVSLVRHVLTVFPRPSSVSRSAPAKTSARRWVMRRTAPPASAHVLSDAKSAAVSSGERTAVGSSRMRTSGSLASAPAISMRCRVPTGSVSTRVSASPSSKAKVLASLATRARRAAADSKNGAAGSRNARLSPTLAAPIRRSCCGTRASPASRASRGERNATGDPFLRISPESAGRRPAGKFLIPSPPSKKSSSSSSAPALELLRISKCFGETQALSDASLVILPGEIHALLGENGAGKSTLVAIAARRLPADSGEILRNGSPVAFRRPRDARDAGLALVPQHDLLIGAASVGDNLAFLDPAAPFFESAAARRARVARLAKTFAFELGDADTRVDTLPVGTRQRIEIAGALASDPEVLILDEPTAVLSPDETAALFASLRTCAEAGGAVLLITPS